MSVLQTEWCVLSGATSSGKTSTLAALAQLQVPTAPEAWNEYTQSQLERGRTFAQVSADRSVFDSHLLRASVALEAELLSSHGPRLVFLERGILDNVPHFIVDGLEPQEPLQAVFGMRHRYAKVFILDPLPFEDNGVRTVNEPRRMAFDALVEHHYRSFGYPVIRVPRMSVQERVRFILEHAGVPAYDNQVVRIAEPPHT
jgi:predicted ATPase